ncbi:hypothetical protein Tco_0699632 [Tanacetum coccineum]
MWRGGIGTGKNEVLVFKRVLLHRGVETSKDGHERFDLLKISFSMLNMCAKGNGTKFRLQGRSSRPFVFFDKLTEKTLTPLCNHESFLKGIGQGVEDPRKNDIINLQFFRCQRDRNKKFRYRMI